MAHDPKPYIEGDSGNNEPNLQDRPDKPERASMLQSTFVKVKNDFTGVIISCFFSESKKHLMVWQFFWLVQPVEPSHP